MDATRLLLQELLSSYQRSDREIPNWLRIEAMGSTKNPTPRLGDSDDTNSITSRKKSKLESDPGAAAEELKNWSREIALKAKHHGDAEAGSKKMAVAHLMYHMQDITKYAEEEKRCHYCQFCKFPTHEQYPIRITNDVDNEGLPETFQFIDKVIPSANVPIIDEDFVTSCECVEDYCVTNNCTCLGDIEADKLPGLKKNAYHATGQLRGAYLNGHYPIYECGPRCGCSEKCPNRVVQRGRKVPLQIFKTENNRGWGVKTLSSIERGHFVDCYFGELLTPQEAQARRDQAHSAQQKDVYLFALDKFTDKDSADTRLHAPFEIDGEFMSGPTRFINHSCEPNLRIFAVVKHNADQPFHSLAFFALDNIERDSELTFDYLDGITDEDDNKEKKKCLCGAKACRGYLF